MEKLFVEFPAFTKWLLEFMTDDEFANLEGLLRKQPDAGDVIPGTNGLRKVRVANRRGGKGKSGGARVIYLHVPEADWIYFLYGYDKSRKFDLTEEEKRILSRIAEQCRQEALRSVDRE